MPKISVPATSEAVALLQDALAAGHALTISLVAPPRVDRVPPLVTTLHLLLLGLSRAQSRALVWLLEHERVVSREELHVAMSSDGNPVSKPRTVDVILSRMRGKLAVHDIEIVNAHGMGFRLTAAGRDKIRQLLTERSNPDAS